MATDAKDQPGVLVVDDDPILRGLLTTGLAREGFPVWPAASGPEAVRIYAERLRQIDVVLLDVRMPGWDGPRALCSLQALNPQLCCWFMTGMVSQNTEKELLALGAQRFFAKPFHFTDLVQALRELNVAATPASP
jgi:CheY-like chemotaxis protein